MPTSAAFRIAAVVALKGMCMNLSFTRLGAAALSVGLALAAGPAMAQKKGAQPAPHSQAAPPAAPGQPAAPQGPTRVELHPAQTDWTKVCGKDQAANKEICYTTRDFGTAADQPPVLALAIYDVKGDDTKIVRLLMPVGLLLRPGFRFAVDKGATLEGSFEICFPNGCFAEAKVKSGTIDQIKKGTTLNVSVKNQMAAEVIFSLPLEGFGKAFDGPAMDPAVVQAQRQALQEAMQKQAEEQRKALEKAGGATPPAGGAPAPAPAPAPAAPK
jgi:invasion protein IalB